MKSIFLLVTFKNLSLSLILDTFIMICLCEELFRLSLFGDLWASDTWMSKSLCRLRKFSTITSLNFLPPSTSLLLELQYFTDCFFWWYPIIHIGFLHLFAFLFSLLSSGLISKFLSLNSQIFSSFFIWLILLSILYCIFPFIYCILQLQNFCLGLFLIISVTFLNLSFCSLLFSWFCWIVFLCFFVAHWVSLTLLFWILCQINYSSPGLRNQLLEDYCDPLVVPYFLDFSCSLKFCIAVL